MSWQMGARVSRAVRDLPDAAAIGSVLASWPYVFKILEQIGAFVWASQS